MARRAASICRDVTHAGVTALRPNSPKLSDSLVVAFCRPELRSLCHLRCLTFLGINIAVAYAALAGAALGAGLAVRGAELGAERGAGRPPPEGGRGPRRSPPGRNGRSAGPLRA